MITDVMLREAEKRCKSTYGEGHYKHTAFWHFIQDVRADASQEREADRTIRLGDTVAYRTLAEHEGEPEWHCFTVRAMDDRFLYERADRGGDNIAIGSAFRVDAPRNTDVLGIRRCPICFRVCQTERDAASGRYRVVCPDGACGYRSAFRDTEDEAVAAHNELCAAAEKGRKG